MNNIYLPSQFINDNFHYYKYDNYILAITNNNCYTNYNTRYCDCYRIYDEDNYYISNKYSCNINQSNNIELSGNFTDNVYYRNDFDKICVLFLIFSIFCIYIPVKIFSRLFKRGSL